jgi:branched-chain amino acid transport system permease protein/neutral amino acid transport system permease protein
MVSIIQLFWNGLVVGSIIALAALGFTLVVGAANIFNFAYGDYMTVGGYVAFAGYTSYDLPVFAAFVLGGLATAVMAIVFDETVFRPFKDGPPIPIIVVSLALAFIIQSLVSIIWGVNPKLFIITSGIAPDFAGIRVLPQQLWGVGLSVALLVVAYVFLHRTNIGLAIRAMSDDKTLARLKGLPTGKIHTQVIGISGFAAGIAGSLLVLQSQLVPTIGFEFLLIIFVAAIVGGTGNPIGAIIGGLLVGIVQEMSVIVIPAEYKAAVPLIVLIVMIIVKPEGILGRK